MKRVKVLRDISWQLPAGTILELDRKGRNYVKQGQAAKKVLKEVEITSGPRKGQKTTIKTPNYDYRETVEAHIEGKSGWYEYV